MSSAKGLPPSCYLAAYRVRLPVLTVTPRHYVTIRQNYTSKRREPQEYSPPLGRPYSYISAKLHLSYRKEYSPEDGYTFPFAG